MENKVLNFTEVPKRSQIVYLESLFDIKRYRDGKYPYERIIKYDTQFLLLDIRFEGYNSNHSGLVMTMRTYWIDLLTRKPNLIYTASIPCMQRTKIDWKYLFQSTRRGIECHFNPAYAKLVGKI